MPEKSKRCNKCNKTFLTSVNPDKEKDLCGKCLHKHERQEWIKKQNEIEQGYREGHNNHEKEPYFRTTLGTAWGIGKKWIPYEELLELREKYKTYPILSESKETKKKGKRRPKTE